MSTIASDLRIEGNQGGRTGASFSDGRFKRRLIKRGKNLEVRDTEGNVLYTEHVLNNPEFADFAVTTIHAETSSFDGVLLVYLDGFDVNTNNSRHLIVRTDYHIAPPIWFAG